jgi:Arc/MetJ-type ribon-helix-helix transcriptional regulator
VPAVDGGLPFRASSGRVDQSAIAVAIKTRLTTIDKARVGRAFLMTHDSTGVVAKSYAETRHLSATQYHYERLESLLGRRVDLVTDKSLSVQIHRTGQYLTIDAHAGTVLVMKMGTMNISLTPEQAEYVRRSVERDFGNVSEFFRDLLRERMKREIEADLALLQSTATNAPAGPGEREIETILETQRQVRKDLNHARRI